MSKARMPIGPVEEVQGMNSGSEGALWGASNMEALFCLCCQASCNMLCSNTQHMHQPTNLLFAHNYLDI